MVEELWERQGFAAETGKMAMQMPWPVYDSAKTALLFVQSAAALVKDGVYCYPVPAAGDTFIYDGVTYAVTNVYSNIETLGAAAWPADVRAAITKVIFTCPVQPVSTSAWFAGGTALTSITNLDLLDTSDVTTMANMFRECSALTGIDVSHFNTAKVSSMQSMFFSLMTLYFPGSDSWVMS